VRHDAHHAQAGRRPAGGGGDGFEGAWNTNVVDGKTVGVLEVDLDLPMPGVALVRLTPAGHR
jgi:hypothetical protein